MTDFKVGNSGSRQKNLAPLVKKILPLSSVSGYGPAPPFRPSLAFRPLVFFFRPQGGDIATLRTTVLAQTF